MKWLLLGLWPLLAGFVTPTLTGPVMDHAGLLSESTHQVIEQTLRALSEQPGGSQIVVLTVPTLDGLPIEQATIQITDAWQLGKKGEDRGVLLLIATSERKMRIEVGLGLQGDLPDVIAKRIIADIMQPLFRQGDFKSGVLLSVREIIKRTDPSFPVDSYLEGVPRRSRKAPSENQSLMLLIVLLPLIFFLLSAFSERSSLAGRPGRRYRGGRGPWDGGGGFGGFGGSGGGGGGGGFSGGGGGFNGGGASGDW